MPDTTFKTPHLPHRTPRMDQEYANGERMYSDSDESVASTNSDNAGSTSSNADISLVAEFDDLMRYFRSFRARDLETHAVFLNFAQQVKEFYLEHFQAIDECRRLQACIDNKVHECSDLEHKLKQARKFLDIERQSTRAVKKERDDLAAQINLVRELLFKDKTVHHLSTEEVYRKLSFLHNNNLSELELSSNGHQPQLSAIKEINSTGSILSDFSYSRSEDDLDNSNFPAKNNKPVWKSHRPSMEGFAEPALKKRRSSENKAVEIGSSDTVRATTTVVVSKDGPVTATSVIESVPKTPVRQIPTSNTDISTNPVLPRIIVEEWEQRGSPLNSERKIINREHLFMEKTLVMPESCSVCEKRIRFAKTALKCKGCKAVCHVECRNSLPVPCIPLMNTPSQRNGLGVISDYTPTTSPMVPAILVHCINEIELRGLTEVGLYRIPGSERDVKILKERFFKGKGAPCLNEIDVNVICGTVKDFLRSLQEPIITYALWPKFVHAVETKDEIDVRPAFFQIISELPQPNRDTLAYLILHFQKVADSKDCKMNIGNLAKVFGPTIVGYSSSNPSSNNILSETVKNNIVMEQLIKIPSDYWSTFVDIERTSLPAKLQQTPSTDSLLRGMATKRMFTPASSGRSYNSTKKRQKYFPSPKAKH